MAENKNTHLEHVSIKGFKSIKDLDLKMMPVNILIGANGSGKTNFISLFTFLRNLSEGKLQNYVEKQGFANAFFHFGSKNSPEMVIDIDVGYNGYHVAFEHGASDDMLIFKEEYCTIKSSLNRYLIKGSKGESGLLSGSAANSTYVRDYTREYLEDCRVYHFHDTGPSAGFKQATGVDASDYLYDDASNIAAFLYRLKTSPESAFANSYRDIVTAIQTVAPFFHDFFLEPRGTEHEEKIILKWIHRDHDTPFSANQLSDGTARFICMSTLFLQPQSLRPKSIVLDEPELGLHPAALEALADIVKVASKDNQVICSTQSVAFANQFSPEDFIVVDQCKGVSSFKRINPDTLKQWLEEYSMGDIWTKNLIGGRPEW
ncbi:MAG: AAA family ATPase [Pseudomonadales bacterium]|nr:AAA family ATPase [Pseudomonadales bacterium]